LEPEFAPSLSALRDRMQATAGSGTRQNARPSKPPARQVSRVQAIIFDIGRVIVRLEPKRALAILAAGSRGPSAKNKATKATNASAAKGVKGAKGKAAAEKPGGSLDAEAMWAAIQKDPLWHDWQEGRIDAREWHANVCKRFGLKVGFEDFCHAWNSVISPDLILPERLFARLARRARLVLLSNTDEIHVAHMESAFKFAEHFDARIYSNQVGASKPSHKIFQAALRAAGARPENTLFIDDVKAYVLAARKMGMQGIVFKNRGQLEGELRRKKLI
jgi:putative hydrolase of the HAD superfamily